jgi:hypothetical protein
MTSSSGVSSMSRTFVSITGASEYWIARFRGRRRQRVWHPRNHQTPFYFLAARIAPELCRNLSLREQRAQETPGARCTRSRACRIGSTRVSRHRSTGTPGISCAMVLTAYFALSPVTGLSCHRRLADTSAKLDASVGASGPHDFAVRKIAPSSTRCFTSTASQPNVRDDRETPLCAGRDGERCESDLRQK